MACYDCMKYSKHFIAAHSSSFDTAVFLDEMEIIKVSCVLPSEVFRNWIEEGKKCSLTESRSQLKQRIPKEQSKGKSKNGPGLLSICQEHVFCCSGMVFFEELFTKT